MKTTHHENFLKFDLSRTQTPIHIIDKILLKKNLEKLQDIRHKSGVKILLALKGFSQYSLFPFISKYLDGTTASSLFEARLAYTKFSKNVHSYSPAYIRDEFPQIARYCKHIIFNSHQQLASFAEMVPKNTQIGIRINHLHAETENLLYNPASAASRLGITFEEIRPNKIKNVDGLHFHSLCELGADALQRTLASLEKSAVFQKIIKQMKWMNWGGGHHITDENYDTDLLCHLIKTFKKKYHLQDIYLEPGTAVVLNTGVLVSRVLDIIPRQITGTKQMNNLAILDTSATSHMPDVLEMPYTPEVIGASTPGTHKHHYTLGGLTCLAGDVIGEYSFKKKLKTGDLIYFLDMAHYTMVKNNTFNGIRLPSIGIGNSEDSKLRIIKHFSYKDYMSRL